MEEEKTMVDKKEESTQKEHSTEPKPETKSENNKSKEQTNKKQTEEKEEKQTIIEEPKKIHQYIIAGAIIVLMLYLIFFTGGKNEGVFASTYNDFQFRQDGKLWETIVQVGDSERIMPFHYHPAEVDKLSFDNRIPGRFNIARQFDASVVVSIGNGLEEERNAAIAGVEISKITSQIYGMPTTAAFSEQYENFSQANCADSNQTNYVFWITLGNETKVSTIDFCTIIEAPTSEDTVKLADLTAYKLLGVIPYK